jgi:hypothetical protein
VNTGALAERSIRSALRPRIDLPPIVMTYRTNVMQRGSVIQQLLLQVIPQTVVGRVGARKARYDVLVVGEKVKANVGLKQTSRSIGGSDRR